MANLQSRTDFLHAIQRLPVKVDFLPRSHKDVWLRWLSEYRDSAYDRANPNRSAQFIYDKINLPAMIIWLAAASGVDARVVRKAAKTVHPKDKPMTQAAAVRRVLPWSLIASHLNNPPTRFGQKEHATITYGDVVPDLEDIYRSGKKETTKRALIEARLGQGQFRVRVGRRWNDQCAVTGCAISSVLRASHIKPWSKSSDRERLDPANGILLAAHVDALFDCGLISFPDNGKMLVSEQVRDGLNELQLPDRLRRKPMKAEKLFLAYHRRHVLVA